MFFWNMDVSIILVLVIFSHVNQWQSVKWANSNKILILNSHFRLIKLRSSYQGTKNVAIYAFSLGKILDVRKVAGVKDMTNIMSELDVFEVKPKDLQRIDVCTCKIQLPRWDEKEVGYFWRCWHLRLPWVGSDGQRKVFLNFDPSHRILTNCEVSETHLPFKTSMFYLEDYTKDI